jgi:hypothetical protein
MSNSALSTVNAALVTKNYHTSIASMETPIGTVGVATVSYKGYYQEHTDGIVTISSNDSDWINRKQLESISEIVGKRSRDVSLFRTLIVDEKQVSRGFMLPKNLVIETEGVLEETEGRVVLPWKAKENPLRQVSPAAMLRKQYVWVTAHICKQPDNNRLQVIANYAPMVETTRPADFVLDRPVRKTEDAPALPASVDETVVDVKAK